MPTVFITGRVGNRQRSLGAALAAQVSSWKSDGWRERWEGSRERMKSKEAIALSVPVHISSRREGMCRGHSKPITKLIK